MKLIIFGASGRVGRLVVRQAVTRGYEVTAVIHESERSFFGDGVEVIQLDIHDEQAVKRALNGQDFVISTLGSWGTKTKDILTSAMKNIIPEMEKQEMKRIISLTGAETRVESDHPSVSSRILEAMLRLIAPKVYKDGQNHLTLLQESHLVWTILRSPKMRDGKVTNYLLGGRSTQAWDTITRATVAKALLDELESSKYVRKAPIIRKR